MNRLFVLFSAIFAIFVSAAGAPSPLYQVYEHEFHFSPVMLTIIFSVYAFSLLATLLIFGSISDHIGRRPVLLISLAVNAISMFIFSIAPGVSSLILARLLQGIATAFATSVLSATLIDTRPAEKPDLAPVVNTIIPLVGLGTGAILSGFLVQYVFDPTKLIYLILLATFIATAVVVVFTPETAARKSGWAESLRPRVKIPEQARVPFVTVAPALIATWALAGLYVSFGPSIADALLGSPNHFLGGGVILTLTVASTLSSSLQHKLKNSTLIFRGTVIAASGLAITGYGVGTGSLFILFAGTVVSGAGLGPSFTGSFRTIMMQAPLKGRANLAAAVYILSYLAFSIPIILAGIASSFTGLSETVLYYDIVAIVLYLITFALLSLRKSRYRNALETIES